MAFPAPTKLVSLYIPDILGIIFPGVGRGCKTGRNEEKQGVPFIGWYENVVEVEH